MQFSYANVTVYTDGACLGNPGRGGYAAIIVDRGGREGLVLGGVSQTTNNRMELTAAIEALKVLAGFCTVDIRSDSRYLVESVNSGDLVYWQSHGWRRRNGGELANADLWEELNGLLKKHRVTLHWIPGHAGIAYNERVDKLAVAAAGGRVWE